MYNESVAKIWLNPYANKIENTRRRALEKKSLDLAIAKELLPTETEHIAVEISLNESKLKDDMASMEVPIFSLSKVKDTKIWTWNSVDGNKKITVIPSVLGRATIFDKDIIIYVISCLVARKNQCLPLAKTVRFKLYDYLKSKGNVIVGRSDYLRFEEAIKRLKGTTIETNIKTDNVEIVGLFSLIEKALLVKVDGKLECIEITLSDWIFNMVVSLDVATISSDYFKLSKPLEKRLYEIGRKHCYNKADWKISIENLITKSSSRASTKEFNRMLRQVINADNLPDYRVKIDGKFVIFYQKDTKKLANALASR
jgi:plasmid replication initiation protein